jgi:hypothetical protein
MAGVERVRRTVTLPEAAELTGLSPDALAKRIARGTLPSEKEGTRRVVPLAALYAAGLVTIDPGGTITELLDRLERAYARIGQLEAELRASRRAGTGP